MGRSFTGVRGLKRKAAVLCHRQGVDSHHGAVLLYDGPEHGREVEFGGQQSHDGLVRRVAEALPGHKAEICRGAKSQHALGSLRVRRRASARRFVHVRRRGGRTVRAGGSAVFVCWWFFRPDLLWSPFTAHRHVLQAVVSGERRASLAFTKLRPPVLEPHLDVKARYIII